MVSIEDCIDKSKSELLTDSNGVQYIRVYIPETKTYVKIYSNSNNHHGEEDMKKALKEAYLQQFDRY